jgi:hypothetical protein
MWVHGKEVAKWGDADAQEMAFSVTKSVGLLVPDQAVQEVVNIVKFEEPQRDRIPNGRLGASRTPSSGWRTWRSQ